MIGLVWLAMWTGCAKTAPAPPAVLAVEAPAPAPPAAGSVEGGVFTDAVFGASMQVPEGWTATPGTADGALRVRMDGRGGAPTRVELWRFEGTTRNPRPRAGCAWTFEDRGPFLGLPAQPDLLIATCTPDHHGEPRVFAWIASGGGAVWQVEVHAPWSRLLEAHDEGARVVSTLTLPPE